jgi:hypothetical protein
VVRTARCVKILGKGVVKVVHRCNDAKENSNLGEYIQPSQAHTRHRI